MAKHPLTDAYVSYNGQNLSSFVTAVSFRSKTNTVPAAGMSELQDYSMLSTLAIEDITVDFFADFAASSVYATISAIHFARSTATLIVKPTSGADAATNPAFTVTCGVSALPLVDGSRGEAHMCRVVFTVAGGMTVDVT